MASVRAVRSIARVRRTVLRMLTAIQLTRVTMAFGAVADLWLVVLITREGPEYAYLPAARLPLAGVLFVGAAVAVGLFAFGGALNDLLDARHDGAFSPHRPIPAGRVRSGQAAVVTLGALLVAVVAAAAFGTAGILLTVFAAAGILFYDAAGKHVPATGLLVIGLVHAVHMLIPNHELTFTLPVWLAATHAVVVATALHLLEDKRPALTPRAIAALAIGWIGWSVLLLGRSWWQAGEGGFWPSSLNMGGLAFPLLAVGGFAWFVRRKTRGVPAASAAEKLRRYGSLWTCLYAVAWLLALGRVKAAVGFAMFAFCGIGVMIAIRELTALANRPVAYRR